MTRRFLPLIVTTAALIPVAALADSTIEHVMKTGFKAPKGTPKLCEKVTKGVATDEESKKFLELVKQLQTAKPSRGEEAAWKQKVDKLVEATQLTIAKDPTGPEKLKAAANCKACHDEHKE